MRHPYFPQRATVAIAVVACAWSCRAADPIPEPEPPIPDVPSSVPMTEIEPAPPPTAESTPGDVEDEFQKLLSTMGVRFSPAEQTLEVTGWVNMQSGLVEVFACAPQGKTHESVIVLDCVPSGLYAGLLALGLEPGTPVRFGPGGEHEPPTGDPVEIDVRWRDESGAEHVARAEDWIWDDHRKAPMPRAAWIFAGSILQPAPGSGDAVTFAADFVKSLATTYYDASSILENPHAEGMDDAVYYSNESAVPPVGTPLTAVFRRAR